MPPSAPRLAGPGSRGEAGRPTRVAAASAAGLGPASGRLPPRRRIRFGVVAPVLAVGGDEGLDREPPSGLVVREEQSREHGPRGLVTEEESRPDGLPDEPVDRPRDLRDPPRERERAQALLVAAQ